MLKNILEATFSKELLMFRITDQQFLDYIAAVQRRLIREGHPVRELQPLDDIHITVFYGVKQEDYDTIFSLLDDDQYIDISLDERFTYFDTDDGKCLKIAVWSDVLQKYHDEIKRLGYESSYPDYKPHITIAYLDKVVWNGGLTGLNLQISDGEFIWVDTKGEEV